MGGDEKFFHLNVLSKKKNCQAGWGSMMVWSCILAARVGELLMCEGHMPSARYTAMTY